MGITTFRLQNLSFVETIYLLISIGCRCCIRITPCDVLEVNSSHGKTWILSKFILIFAICNTSAILSMEVIYLSSFLSSSLCEQVRSKRELIKLNCSNILLRFMYQSRRREAALWFVSLNISLKPWLQLK